jgi:tryptophan synthase alpha chain
MPSKLTQRIREAQAAGRKALIPYLPAGFPGLEEFWTAVADLDRAGADIIEIGVPFSDPVADGPTVEQAALESLERGVTLKWILEELEKRAGQFHAGIVLMGYLNPFLQYGMEAFAQDAARAGVNGVIIPDLPHEEAADIRATLAARGLDLIPLVGLNTSPARLALYADGATGFAYFVSVLGVTGERATLPQAVGAKLAEAKNTFAIPLALGFGIKTPDQLAALGEGPDAVVFGSALITHLRAGGTPAQFLAAWR